MTTEHVWTAVGLFGQLLFSARFILQWIASERRKQSVVPREFWYLSLAGALIVLSYAIHKLEPVLILGYAPGLLIYSRNIYLIHKTPEAPAHG
jgi:lipid-A-disaccharide synthase-like uncharacterized protein